MEKSMTELRSVTCRMWSHSVTCHPTQVSAPRLNPSHGGRYSIYLPRRDGRLSWPCYSETQTPGVELATSRSRIQRPNHWATEQHECECHSVDLQRASTSRRGYVMMGLSPSKPGLRAFLHDEHHYAIAENTLYCYCDGMPTIHIRIIKYGVFNGRSKTSMQSLVGSH